jgi:ketosteroid isomerase-like protein
MILRAMAEESLALCRRAYELYGRGDFDSMLELFGEDVEVYVAPPNFESGTYRGRADYRALIERWGAAWATMRIEPKSMKAVGEWILATVEYRGSTHESDLEIKQLSWELSLWRDGAVRQYEVHFDPDRGRAAFADREAQAAATP